MSPEFVKQLARRKHYRDLADLGVSFADIESARIRFNEAGIHGPSYNAGKRQWSLMRINKPSAAGSDVCILWLGTVSLANALSDIPKLIDEMIGVQAASRLSTQPA